MSAADGPVSHRVNLRFSAGGRFSTSVVADDRGRSILHGWELGPAGPRHRFGVEVPELVSNVGLPLADGRTVLVEHGLDCHRLTVLDAEGRGDDPIRLTPSHLSPPPAGSTALAVGLRSEGSRAVVSLVDSDGATDLTAVDGAPVRSWAAGDGLILATAAGAVHSLDVRTGRLERLPDEVVPAGAVLLAVSGEHFLLAAPADSGSRLFLGSRTGPPRELTLPAEAGSAVPVAVDPAGRRAALVVERGASSRLVLVGADGRQISTGLASLTPAAAWTEHGLWGIGSSPDRPAGYFWLPPGESEVCWSTPAEDGPPVRLETVPGAAGDLEAVRYGPHWRTASRVVLALHGGPREHWRAAYDPALRSLAGTGACVLALNQRGSTGYGSDFELAIRGCWGGPDLADVLAVAAWLRRDTGANPVLWGVSYGAYLALLAAAAEPDGWAGCVAVSPFVSAASLAAFAAPGVRALIDRLDGCRPIVDDLGARDLVRLAPRIRCPTVIAHGALDRTIPVEQARAIGAAMAAGPAGDLLGYLEIPDRDHGVLRPHPDESVMRAGIGLIREPAPILERR